MCYRRLLQTLHVCLIVRIGIPMDLRSLCFINFPNEAMLAYASFNINLTTVRFCRENQETNKTWKVAKPTVEMLLALNYSLNMEEIPSHFTALCHVLFKVLLGNHNKKMPCANKQILCSCILTLNYDMAQIWRKLSLLNTEQHQKDTR